MTLPDFFKQIKFWEAVSLALSGLLALLAFFGKLDPAWAVSSAVVFAWISALLKMFGVELEFRLRAEVARLRGEVSSLRESLRAETAVVKSAKKLNK